MHRLLKLCCYYYIVCYRVIREFLQKQETIFDICIEQLKPDLREHYESLAIFCEDVNITPKVCILKFILKLHNLLHIFLI